MCHLACRHQSTLGVLLAIELLLCAAWLAIWLLRGGACGACGLCTACAVSGRSAPGDAAPHQFVVCAADPQWHEGGAAAELQRPLLSPNDDS